MTSKQENEIKEIRQNLDFLKIGIEQVAKSKAKINKKEIPELLEKTSKKHQQEINKINSKLDKLELQVEKINKNLKTICIAQGFSYD